MKRILSLLSAGMLAAGLPSPVKANDALVQAKEAAEAAEKAPGQRAMEENRRNPFPPEKVSRAVETWTKPKPSVKRYSERVIRNLLKIEADLRGLDDDLKIGDSRERKHALLLRTCHLEAGRQEAEYDRDLLKKIVAAPNLNVVPERLALLRLEIKQSGILSQTSAEAIAQYSPVKPEVTLTYPKEDAELLRQLYPELIFRTLPPELK